MNKSSCLSVVGLCLLSSAATAQNESGKARPNLVATAKAAGSFKTLLAAAGAADLAGVLSSKGPFTVFAPTDDAFAKLPAGTVKTLLKPANRPALVAILKHHVVVGRVTASQGLRAGTAKTLNETSVRLRIEGGQLKVNNAKVINNDIAASNGIIHVIDTVLTPKLPAAAAVLDTSAQELIRAAVSQGVPLFNAGQQEACAAIYEIAVRGLIRAQGVSESSRTMLTKTLRASLQGTRTDAAWTLREGLDKAYESLDGAGTANARSSTSAKSNAGASPKALTSRGRTVFDFSESTQARQFRIVNDTVMGGRSRSRMQVEDGIGVFSGVVSLQNNGGFASCRAAVKAGSLSGAQGFVLRVKGDGRTYRLTAREGRTGFDQKFTTEKGEWMEVRLPIAKLRRNWRGYRPGGKPPSAAKLTGVGLIIGDKLAGPFRLEVDWIRAYGQPAASF